MGECNGVNVHVCTLVCVGVNICVCVLELPFSWGVCPLCLPWRFLKTASPWVMVERKSWPSSICLSFQK